MDNRGTFEIFALVMTKELHCLECWKPLYGRSDKKFCSAGCKNGWHYQNSAELRRYKSWTHSALNRNHRILQELLGNESRHFSLPELQLRGFTPHIVTGYRGCAPDGSKQFACYDILYTQSSTEIYQIYSASLND